MMALNTGHQLTTARMTLTDITEADFVATYAADRDPLVARYVGDGLPESRSFADYSDYFKGRITLWMNEQYRLWVMRLHNEDAVIGWVMLRPVNNSKNIEVGYRLPQSSWGKGYATEATRAVLDYGFNTVGLEEITAVTHPDNAASQHVLTKAGLVRNGTFNYNGGGEIPFFRLCKQDFLSAHGN
jgi:[ribosomal protein S5]-alanine N-acetyltransferase